MDLGDILIGLLVIAIAFPFVRAFLLWLLENAGDGGKWSGLWFVAFLIVFFSIFGIYGGYAGSSAGIVTQMAVTAPH